jgi:hypothetical protein
MSKSAPTTTVKNNDQRLQLAAQISQGLLASQNPEKGWNLDTLAILSLKIADNLVHFSQMEKLPELISAGKKNE